MSNYYTPLLTRFALLMGLLLIGQQLAGQQKVWTGAVNSNWSNVNNWNPNQAPGPGDEVVFDGAALRACNIDIDPVVKSIKARSNFIYSISLGTHTLTVGGDFAIATASQFTSSPGSKVIFNGAGDIDCAASIHEVEINAPANATIDLRSPLNVNIVTITQVGMLDGDDLRAAQQIINNDPGLDGDSFLTAAGTCTFTGNPIRLLQVESGATLQLLSDLTLERNFHLLGGGQILGSNTLLLGSEGELEFTGLISANIEVNTSDPAHAIRLSEDFRVAGSITITQVGEFLRNNDIRAGGDIIVNDSDIGNRTTIVATGNGTLSGTGTLTNLTVETGATLQLASGFILRNNFELRGGGMITGPYNLILASAGRVDFTGTVSNVEINMPGTRGSIRFSRALNITGNLTVTSAVSLASNEIRVSGNIFITDNQINGTTQLVMAGSGATIFQGAGNGIYPILIIDKNNATDRAQLNSSDEFFEVIVRRGVLDLNGQAPFVGLATVESNGTLGGTGTLEGDVEGPGKISPGNSPGTLSIIGDINIAGTLVMEIFGRGENAGGTAGSDFDQLIVDGDVTISSLSVIFIGTIGPTFPVSGDLYTLVDATGTIDPSNLFITPPNVNAFYVPGILTISSPALPIELLYFTATAGDKSVLLQWATATEQNNDYMAIERSADGIKFEELGRVKGAGTTQEQQQYRFTDERPLPGINYYRLRQVDYDGAIEYHKVISVVFDDKGPGLAVLAFPNPARSALQARWAPHPDEPTALRLADANGSILAEYLAPAGAGTYEIPLEGIPAGVFFLQMKQGEKVEVIQLIKQ